VNLKNAFEGTLKKLKEKDEAYAEKVQEVGNKDPMNYHYMSWFSGALAGFRFVWYVLDHDLSRKEYDELERELVYSDIPKKEQIN